MLFSWYSSCFSFFGIHKEKKLHSIDTVEKTVTVNWIERLGSLWDKRIRLKSCDGSRLGASPLTCVWGRASCCSYWAAWEPFPAVRSACSSGGAAGGDDPAPRTTTTARLQRKHTDTDTCRGRVSLPSAHTRRPPHGSALCVDVAISACLGSLCERSPRKQLNALVFLILTL